MICSSPNNGKFENMNWETSFEKPFFHFFGSIGDSL